MNSHIAFRIRLALALLLVMLSVCAVLAQTKYVPFKGNFTARDTGVLQGPTVLITGNGTGIASHIGQFTFNYTTTLNLPTSTSNGFIQLIVANGDVIYGSTVGRGEPTDTPNVTHVIELVTITGGTGRFHGATGGFTLDRLLFEVNDVGLTSGSLTGTISTTDPPH